QAIRPAAKGPRGRVQGIRDPLSEQARMVMLRSALDASTRENAQLRREVARLRAENAHLRATGRTPHPGTLSGHAERMARVRVMLSDPHSRNP
ncbi:MAG: hypothetical protein ACXVFO_18955, partial [Solirubrobacteraceae bacterium]